MIEFNIKLTPQVRDDVSVLVLAKKGEILILQDLALDLSFLADGDILPAGAIEHPLLSEAQIRRRGNLLEVDALVFPINPDCTDPVACFPEPVHVVQDGPISLPDQGLTIQEDTHAN
ncbi:hypothetical protein [Alcaligenes sp. WGS1538]|uniref:hypothetical protein n=1 Tax=Alcaligenes sp. WGS1538 TaxID=3366811 RepID=UPI00372D79E1